MHLKMVIICVCALVLGVSSELDPIKMVLKLVNSTSDFRSQNPHVKLIPFESNSPARGQIRYILGRREKGDRLVASGGDYQRFPGESDVDLYLSYPESGFGAILTFVDIVVEQTSTIGEAYAVDGGIGERYITVLVQARNTQYFSHSVGFYGS